MKKAYGVIGAVAGLVFLFFLGRFSGIIPGNYVISEVGDLAVMLAAFAFAGAGIGAAVSKND